MNEIDGAHADAKTAREPGESIRRKAMMSRGDLVDPDEKKQTDVEKMSIEC